MTATMTEKEMFEKAMLRPKDFFHLSAEERWMIDKSLGILDWAGDDLSDEDIKRFNDHFGIK